MKYLGQIIDKKGRKTLASDASDYGVGEVILHKYDGGKMKAFAHTSRLLLAEKIYSQII